MNEHLQVLEQRREEIMYSMIEADSYEYRELEIELAEIEDEINALLEQSEQEREL